MEKGQGESPSTVHVCTKVSKMMLNLKTWIKTAWKFIAYVDHFKKNRYFLNVYELIFFRSLSVGTETSMKNMFCGKSVLFCWQLGALHTWDPVKF